MACHQVDPGVTPGQSSCGVHVAMGQVSYRTHRFSPVNIIPLQQHAVCCSLSE